MEQARRRNPGCAASVVGSVSWDRGRRQTQRPKPHHATPHIGEAGRRNDRRKVLYSVRPVRHAAMEQHHQRRVSQRSGGVLQIHDEQAPIGLSLGRCSMRPAHAAQHTRPMGTPAGKRNIPRAPEQAAANSRVSVSSAGNCAILCRSTMLLRGCWWYRLCCYGVGVCHIAPQSSEARRLASQIRGRDL